MKECMVQAKAGMLLLISSHTLFIQVPCDDANGIVLPPMKAATELRATQHDEIGLGASVSVEINRFNSKQSNSRGK